MRVQKNRIFAAMYRQFLILMTFLLLPVLTHELLIVGGYQYASDPASSSKLPLCNVELNTPLFTKQSSIRQATGQPVYGCLSVNKQFGQRWSLGVDWHDMFDAICHDVAVNRHAANIKLQYRF